ncbi:thiamine diphosphokinase [Malassezia psittaci]|uniref:Thiamine diphosphokinase n=1 Tax=Malassezia psittaci TaxID=1821823 RepID=A0AAF0FCI5_9BASI|nr:thiamine diphosphokinase [Malassezia psittaci]
MSTVLPIVAACQNDDPWADTSLHAFCIGDVQIGFVLPKVLQAVRRYLDEHRTDVMRVDSSNGKLSLVLAYNASKSDRTDFMADLAQWLRDTNQFADPLDGMCMRLTLIGWRNEQYAIYGRQSYDQASEIVFTLERAACALFGLTTFGVHLTVGCYLDNSVAGGITAGDSPRASIVRECEEEAGLSGDQVEPYLTATGAITYFYRTSQGWRQPEMQYTYDLALPSDEIVLHPEDGEAESFELLSVSTVIDKMHKNEFKPNCALVLVDFLIRHGYITPETEAYYARILSTLHTDLRLPVSHS